MMKEKSFLFFFFNEAIGQALFYWMKLFERRIEDSDCYEI